MKYECCIRTNVRKPIEWDEAQGWFQNSESEEELSAESPEHAAERYVQEHLTCCGLGDVFEEYGGEICHTTGSCRSAKVEVWVREAPGEDYSQPQWQRYIVPVSATAEYDAGYAKSAPLEAKK